jgi:hypothetical protein
MTNDTTIQTLIGMIASKTSELNALQAALDIVQTGFQSDTVAIKAAKDEVAAVQAKLVSVKEQIALV